MRRADIIGSVVMLGFSLLMLLVLIPLEVEDGTWYGLSPYFYPNLICSLLGIFAFLLLAQAIFRPHLYPGQSCNLSWFQFAVFLLLVAVTLIGVWLISEIGIIIGGPLLIIAVALIMGERRVKPLLFASLVPVAVVYLIATYVLKTPLP